MKPHMKLLRAVSPAFTVLVCIFLGLTTSVAIAWAFAWKTDLRGPVTVATRVRVPADGEGTGRVIFHASTRIGTAVYTCMLYEVDSTPQVTNDAKPERIVARWAMPHVVPWKVGEKADAPSNGWSQEGFTSVIGHGWPFICVWSMWTAGPTPTTELMRIRLEGGIELPNRMFEGVLPYRPAWFGLLFNTLLYGSIFWAIGLGWRLYSLAHRRRRGRCLACNYDLRGLTDPVCPECGLGIE